MILSGDEIRKKYNITKEQSEKARKINNMTSKQRWKVLSKYFKKQDKN